VISEFNISNAISVMIKRTETLFYPLLSSGVKRGLWFLGGERVDDVMRTKCRGWYWT